MRRPVLFLIILSFASPPETPAHPGMTDRYDGHKCFRKCEDWNILYGEYHLHDKDRKPVRVAKKPRPARQKEAMPAETTAETALPPQASVPAETVRQVVVVREQNVPQISLLLLVLLALLILWLVIRMNRGREKTES